jgi:hypothetical protein
VDVTGPHLHAVSINHVFCSNLPFFPFTLNANC